MRLFNKRFPLCILGLIFCIFTNAYAFKTQFFNIIGKPIHWEILKDALSPLGFQPASLNKVREGCDSQDWPASPKFTKSPDHHFDDNNISQGHEYIRKQLNYALIRAENADKNSKDRDAVLYTLGELFHTLQDFYSHSNYLEWALRNNRPLKPIDWQKIPKEIRTGYFYYHWELDNETFSVSRASAAKKIRREFRKRNSEVLLHTDAEFQKRQDYPTYDNALDYVLGEREVLHYELNKDDSGSLQGSIIAPSVGKNLYQIARGLATDDTARHWELFCQMLRQEYGGRSPAIIAALKGAPLEEKQESVLPLPEKKTLGVKKEEPEEQAKKLEAQLFVAPLSAKAGEWFNSRVSIKGGEPPYAVKWLLDGKLFSSSAGENFRMNIWRPGKHTITVEVSDSYSPIQTAIVSAQVMVEEKKKEEIGSQARENAASEREVSTQNPGALPGAATSAVEVPEEKGPYSVFLLTNASYGLYLGTEGSLKGKIKCSFAGGGIDCKPNDFITYEKLLGPFEKKEQAQSALCRAVTKRHVFPLGIGLKGQWQGDEKKWYGLWDESVTFECKEKPQEKTEGMPLATVKEIACKDRELRDVEYIRDGKSYPLTTGFKLAENDRIRTGLGCKAVLAFPNVELKVEELTEFKIGLFKLGKFNEVELWMKAGEVQAQVSRTAAVRTEFTVKSPTCAASVRGTKFTVRVNKDNSTDVIVYDGEVNVTQLSSNKEIVIGAGKKIHVTENRMGAEAPESVPVSPANMESFYVGMLNMGFAAARSSCIPADNPMPMDVAQQVAEDFEKVRQGAKAVSGYVNFDLNKFNILTTNFPNKAGGFYQLIAGLYQDYQSAVSQSSKQLEAFYAGTLHMGFAAARASCLMKNPSAPLSGDAASMIQDDLNTVRQGIEAFRGNLADANGLIFQIEETKKKIGSLTTQQAYNELVGLYQKIQSAVKQGKSMPAEEEVSASGGDCADCAYKKCPECAGQMVVLCESASSECQLCINRKCK